MTSKRFTVSKNGLGKWVIEDALKEGLVVNIPMFLGFDNEESGKYICDLWNEFHEETQAVRSILKEYDDFDGYVDSAMGMEFLNRIAIAVGMELKE